MLRIKCINSKCIAPEGKFTWDDLAHAEGGAAAPRDKGAISFLADCPYCGTENKIWLFKVKQVDSVTRGK